MIKSITILTVLTACLYFGVSQLYAEVKARLDAAVPTGNNQVGEIGPAGDDAVEEAIEPTDARFSYDIIVTRNIFQANLKAAPLVEEEPDLDLENLEETSLKLVLQGTVAGSDKDARAIIIDERQKRQDLYRVGDSVQNAVITQIERGRIVLEHNGQREILVLKERKSGGSSPRSGALVNQPFDIPDIEPQVPEARAPVVRPRRRISFRQRQAVPEQEDAQEDEGFDLEEVEEAQFEDGDDEELPEDNFDEEQDIPEAGTDEEDLPPDELVQ